MAVDYLSYLYSFDSLKILKDKYNMMQYDSYDGEFKCNYFKTIFESEMSTFYKDLKHEYSETLEESN